MGWFDGHDNTYEDSYDQWNEYDPSEDDSSSVHELLAGFACYKASMDYEDREDNNGKPGSYEEAREIMVGLVDSIINREVENKGLDFIDTEKVMSLAQKNINEVPPSYNGW